MKLKVLKPFNDKDANALRAVGEVFEVAAKRGEELLGHPLGLVEKLEDDEKAEMPEKAEKPEKKAAEKKQPAKKAEKE